MKTKFLVEVNDAVYGYDNADMLLISVLEHPNDCPKLWKINNDRLAICYKPMDLAELKALASTN